VLRSTIAAELATVDAGPAFARERAQLDALLAEADAAGAPLAMSHTPPSPRGLEGAPADGPAWAGEPELAWRLRALVRRPDAAHLTDAVRAARDTDRYARASIGISAARAIVAHDALRDAILDGLDDVGAVEVRAALASHAPPDLARRLVAEATPLQLRGGDVDSYVNRVRCAPHLGVADGVELVLGHLGPASVDAFLAPCGDLWHAAPLLARVLSGSEIVALAARVVEAAAIPDAG
jgi:hypothetical protein